MVFNAFEEIFEFLGDMEDDYRDEIKGKNLSAFTQNRKVTPYPLLLQNQLRLEIETADNILKNGMKLRSLVATEPA